ncbi:TRAF-like family protein [Citrus sinensis]|nr:TRAF-like family protein [Citrus sinensis]
MGKERRFHGLKLEWGFDQFIPLEEFNDASNGYLLGDTCVFGAEVLVKERNKCKGDQKWKILLLPKGLGEASGSHISMYLRLTDLSTITAGEWLNTSTQFGGWKKFVELNYLNKAGNGFLVNDVCIVEAEVPVLGISKAQ